MDSLPRLMGSLPRAVDSLPGRMAKLLAAEYPSATPRRRHGAHGAADPIDGERARAAAAAEALVPAVADHLDPRRPGGRRAPRMGAARLGEQGLLPARHL